MVYADLAVLSKNKNSSMPCAIDLDDTYDEYAQINVKEQKETTIKPQIPPNIKHGTSGCNGHKYYKTIYACNHNVTCNVSMTCVCVCVAPKGWPVATM